LKRTPRVTRWSPVTFIREIGEISKNCLAYLEQEFKNMLFIVFPLQIIMIKFLILLLHTQFNRSFYDVYVLPLDLFVLLHVTFEQFDVLLLYTFMYPFFS
jgi:hypothetical protein